MCRENAHILMHARTHVHMYIMYTHTTQNPAAMLKKPKFSHQCLKITRTKTYKIETVREKINNMQIIQVPEATNIQPTHKANAEKERH